MDETSKEWLDAYALLQEWASHCSNQSFLTERTLLRYLRARKGDFEKSREVFYFSERVQNAEKENKNLPIDADFYA